MEKENWDTAVIDDGLKTAVECLEKIPMPVAVMQGETSTEHLECTGCGGQFEREIKRIDA